MTEALDRLAALAGIEEGWWDFFGVYRRVPDDTKRAFLEAMGFAVADDGQIAASLQDLELRPWRRWLEPVQVVSATAGAEAVFSLTVADREEDLPLFWTLSEEGGAVHQGEVRPRGLPVLAEREVDGQWHRRHRLTLPALPPAGVHRLRLAAAAGGEAVCTLIVAPPRAAVPAELGDDAAGGGRLWGIATQLYALRGEGDWGVGDFSALAALARRAAALGASAVGVNPLHALFPSRPERFSPYSPSSRLFLNLIYLDVEAVPDFQDSIEARRQFASPGLQARLAAARNARLVDYETVGRMKLAVLEACWASFRRQQLGQSPGDRGAAFRAFQRAGGDPARRFALFEALQEHFLGQNLAYWRHWPAAYQVPDSPEVAAFAAAQDDRVDFFWYLQWLADGQLAAAQRAARQAGMPVGLYRDLGVGIADDGAEAWANQSLLCLGVSVGAPPDPLNLAGQDWGLVPFNPLALREAAYAPFLAVLEANMTHAGAMRLDHAMSLQRLYWVPRGARADQGAYVRYPVEDLFALVALASHRKNCLVIGEDLGTVPDGFRERMEATGLLGYRLMVFEKKDGGVYKSAGEIARPALVALGTHDLPSLPGWWQGIDVAARERLNLYPDPAMGRKEREGRAWDRHQLLAVLIAEGLLPADFPGDADLDGAAQERLASAVHAHLGQAPAKLLMVQMEDLLGLVVQMNLPGTTDQHPNWRYRYPRSLESLLDDPRWPRLATQLAGRSFRRPA